MQIEVNDVIIDSRVTTVNVKVTFKPGACKKYHVAPYYSVDKYITKPGQATYTVFDMLGEVVKEKEARKVLNLIQKQVLKI